MGLLPFTRYAGFGPPPALTRVSSPAGVPFAVAAPYADRFSPFLRDLEASGYAIKPGESGGYNPRFIAGTNIPSQHAGGRAIDVNWTDNARGTRGDIDPTLARNLSAKHGLTWGGDWKNPDPMHFEVSAKGPQMKDLPTPAGAYGESDWLDPGSPLPATTQPGAPATAVAGATQRAPERAPSMPGLSAAAPEQQQGFGDYLNNALYSPLFMMGANVLGAPNIGTGLSRGLEQAGTAQINRLRGAAMQDELDQSKRMRAAWGAVFPHGQANTQHPLLQGVPSEFVPMLGLMGAKDGLEMLQKFALTKSLKTLDTPMKEADLALKRAHADYYRAATEAKRPPVPPSAGRLGMNEAGQLILAPQGAEQSAQVLGVFDTTPDQMKKVPSFLDPKASARFNAAMDDHKIIMDEMGTKPKVGHIWARNPDGTIYQKKMMELEDKSINPTVIDQSINNLRDSFKVLVGGVDENGLLKADGPLKITQGLSQATGGYVSPQVAQSYKAAEHAIMNLSYALSGKTVGQAEQKRILDMYMPTVMDSPEMKAFKINSAYTLFKNLQAARSRGASDSQLSDMFESALTRSSSGVQGRPQLHGDFVPNAAPPKAITNGRIKIERID